MDHHGERWRFVMDYQKITLENVLEFPPGTEVEFFYGAYYPTEYGTVTGYEITKFGVVLTAVTEDGEEKTISMFSDKGVGTRLIKKAVSKVNRNSPWYQE